MMERMTSKGKGVLIKEIMDDHVNDAIGKKFDGASRNSGKLPLLIFHHTTQVRKDGTVVANDFCIFDSENEFPPPWFTKIMLADRTKRPSDEFEFRKLLKEIDHVFDLGMDGVDFEQAMDEILFYGPNEVNFERGMDGLDFEHEMDELLYYGPNEVDFEQGMDGLNFEHKMDKLLFFKPNKSHKRSMTCLLKLIALDELDQVIEAQYVSNLFAIYDEPSNDEGGVVPVEVVTKEMVVEEAFDGDDGEQVVFDGDAIPTEVYDVMVA
uniref:Uncharacterized protein n=1 Tax=Tanacetum cinerariifolium TaxID=118510 RepID=A0A699H7M8_TANCI|nr:hypothetical protein [Tanacetum cinerariifolium]